MNQSPKFRSLQPSTHVSRPLVLTVVLCIATLSSFPLAKAQSLSNGKGNLRVMTYNVYAGTSYVEALTAETLPELLLAVTTTLDNVHASNPPERSAAIAREISMAQPDLISIQEAVQWITCPTEDFQTCSGPPTVEYDLLQLLVQALEQQGQHYQVVVSTTTFTLAAPSSTGLIVQATDRLAILARTDLNANQFQYSNIQTASYVATFTPKVAGIPFPVRRAWASLDVGFHQETFRFIATHLESAHPVFTDAQATELLDGPASTLLPVVIAMDANTNPLPPDPTAAIYQKFLNRGFTDAWTAVNPYDPGLTWGDYTTQPPAMFIATNRPDQIFARGGIEAKAADLLGGDATSPTINGLWPSDHLGLAARFKMPPEIEGE